MNHQALLHLFDGHRLRRLFAPAESHLSKSSSADDFYQLIIFDAHAPSGEPQLLGLFMQNVEFDSLLLILAEIHTLHFLIEQIPVLFLVLFLQNQLRITTLDEQLRRLHLLSGLGRDHELFFVRVHLNTILSS